MQTEIDRGYTLERPMFPGQPNRVRCDACSTTKLLAEDEEVAEGQAGEWYRAHATTAAHRRKLVKADT